MKISANYKA